MADDKQFNYKEIYADDLKDPAIHDFGKLYERAHDEMSLQQTKRDQIITLYIALFSLLIPFALSLESLDILAKGLIFLTVGIIGLLFTFITIRYRVYKEVYWLCCETITCIANLKEDRLNKESVQNLFYKSLKKKGSKYVTNGKRGKKWASLKYFNKNIFSSETLHFIIIDLMTAILLGLSAFLICPFEIWIKILIAIALGLIIFIVMLTVYFYYCADVYSVLVDNKDSSFNRTFSKAWFLHIYVDLPPRND